MFTIAFPLIHIPAPVLADAPGRSGPDVFRLESVTISQWQSAVKNDEITVALRGYPVLNCCPFFIEKGIDKLPQGIVIDLIVIFSDRFDGLHQVNRVLLFKGEDNLSTQCQMSVLLVLDFACQGCDALIAIEHKAKYGLHIGAFQIGIIFGGAGKMMLLVKPHSEACRSKDRHCQKGKEYFPDHGDINPLITLEVH
ncbi:hypothetical protein AB1287_01660 [Enterobacter asburiae]|uniref:hypothetical protein n=1 Tax=Scandinavium sp. UTDF21-P1B TaxID=3446379 RepID=UPI00346D7C92